MSPRSVATVRQAGIGVGLKGVGVAILLAGVLAPGIQAQRGRTPMVGGGEDSVIEMTAQDSAIFRGRITASENPYNNCTSQAFQTCASGELEARLSSDGTAYGVLYTRHYDGRSLYLWRITRGGGGGGGAGGGGRGRGGGGRGAKRRG